MNQVKNSQFKFNIQLFAEGDTPAPEPAAEPSAPPSAPAATEQDSIDYSEFGKGNATDQLDLLKRHGFLGGDEPEQPEEHHEPAETNEEPEPEGQPATEPVEQEVEIKVNGEVKKVKLSEAVNLAQMGFDYTQKTQALAERQRQLEAIMAQQQQPQQPDRVKQTEQEYQVVAALVERQLGLNPGEYNTYDPIHNFAFQQAAMTQNTQKLAREAVSNRINTFMQSAQTDPLAQQVDANFDNYIFKLGSEGAEGAQKAQALLMAKQRLFAGSATMQDLDALEAHWNTVKTAISAPKKPPVQAKQKVEPPVTEKPGSSVEPPKTRMDYKKLGRMKQSDQLAYLKDSGFLKRDKT